MRAIFRFAFCVLCPIGAFAQTPAPRPVSIGVIDSVWSPTLKEYRRYWVYTPPSYRQSVYLPRAYPVVYLLDGDAHFHSVSGLLQILGTGVNGTYVVPEMIVVAIPNTDRTRDLTPTHDTVPAFRTSGGGPNFLKFMKSELIPHIDSAYRTEPYRLLIGHSFGGITAISALYTIPETFNAYIAIDPSLWWDHQVLLKKAKAYFSKPAPRGRSLFVGQANTLSPDDTSANVHYNSIMQFNSVLETYNQSGIRYAFKYYAHDDHGSVPMIAEYDGLRFIFDGYKLDMQRAADRPALIAEHFDKLSATMGYKVLPPERIVDVVGQIALGRDTTKAIALRQLNIELYPKSSNAFLMLGNTLLAKRDTSRARSAFERALGLNPENPRAQDALKRLSAGPTKR